MSLIVTISGSPSSTSRSAALLALIRHRLVQASLTAEAIEVRDLPAEDLLRGRSTSAAIEHAVNLVQLAQGVVVATPVYKAAYSGLLKTFLDLLPQQALEGKIVLPLVTGASPAHALALDYALRPVLVALGAQLILSGLYLTDKQIIRHQEAPIELEPTAAEQLNSVLVEFSRFFTA